MSAEIGKGVIAESGSAALDLQEITVPRSKAERVVGTFAKAVALAMAAFQLYTAITVSFSPMVQRSVHLAFALCLLYLVTPTRPRAGDRKSVV